MQALPDTTIRALEAASGSANAGDMAAALASMPSGALEAVLPLLREQSKAAFKDGRYEDAEGGYTSLLAALPEDAAVLANRSLCRIRRGDEDGALADAERCIRVAPDFEKGWYRK
eukprot:gene6262-6081_t